MVTITEHAHNWIRGIISDKDSSNVQVVFTKADRTERTMWCTLDMDMLDEEHLPSGAGRGIATSDEVCRVFDLDKNAWRSFRWDSIKRIQYDHRETGQRHHFEISVQDDGVQIWSTGTAPLDERVRAKEIS